MHGFGASVCDFEIGERVARMVGLGVKGHSDPMYHGRVLGSSGKALGF